MYLGFFKKHTHFGSRELLVAFCVALLFAGYFRVYLSDWLHAILAYLFPVLLITQSIFLYVTASVHANYIYNTLHLNPFQTIYFVILAFALLWSRPGEHLLRIKKYLIFFTAFVFAQITYTVFLFDIWTLIEYYQSNDDNIIEYAQFFCYAGAAIAAFLTSRQFKHEHPFIAKLFIGVAIILFFIAGEEISWGQRLLGVTTPEYFAEKNKQGETNLHNLDFIFGKVYRSYILLNVLAAGAWPVLTICSRLVKRTSIAISKYIVLLRRWFAPEWYYLPYFVTSGCIFYLHREMHVGMLQNFEEFSELMMALGIAFFMLEKYIESRHAKK